MKQIISISLILFSVLLVNQSCSKESPYRMATPVIPDQTINATVLTNNAYVLNVNSLESVSINKQAAHFTVSQTEVDAKNGTPVYKYIPEKNYTGNDEVVLRTSKTTYVSGGNSSGCNGGNNSHASTSTSYYNVIIKFTVTK